MTIGIARPARIALLTMIALTATYVSGDAPESGGDSITMSGVDLQFHEDGPTFGEQRQPKFRVHAETAEADNAMQHWILDQANAVILRADQEELLVTAARGICDLEAQFALLSDGVRATAGKVTIDLQDLHWDNKTGLASSDTFSETTDGTNTIQSNAIDIYPNEDLIEMFEVSGRFHMAGTEPPPAEAKPKETEPKNQRYKYLDLDSGGGLDLSIGTGRFGTIRDGVVLTLIADDPADNLTIRAREVEFTYVNEDASDPTGVRLNGDVEFNKSEFTGRADHLTIDFESGETELSGNASMDSDMFDSVRAPTIRYNLNTEALHLAPGNQIRRFQLFGNADDENEPEQQEPRP